MGDFRGRGGEVIFMYLMILSDHFRDSIAQVRWILYEGGQCRARLIW